MSRSLAIASVLLLAGFGSVGRAQVTLNETLVEGAKTSTETTVMTQQILTINGTDVATEGDQTITTTKAIGSRRPDGTLPIVVTVDAIRADLALPGDLSLSFDSANPPAEKDDSPIGFLVEALRAMVGARYTITLDKQDKFVSVEGMQAILDRATELDPKAADYIKNQLDPATVERSYAQEHNYLPPGLVRAGDTWESTEVEPIGGGQTLTFRKRYEYRGTVERDGRTLDKIDVRSLDVAYRMEPQANAPAQVDKSALGIEDSEGTILFDREAGRTVDVRTKDRITGDLTLRINQAELPSTLDLTLETRQTTRD